MIKIVKGHRLNTDADKALGYWSNDYEYTTDLMHVDEIVYYHAPGHVFYKVTEGGPATDLATVDELGNVMSGERLELITREQAIAWAHDRIEPNFEEFAANLEAAEVRQ